MAEWTAAQLEAMLAGLYDIRKQRDSLRSAYETGTQPVRDWLNRHIGESLRDGETRTFARLQEPKGTDELDAIGLAEKRPELLLWLAGKGCLKLDSKAWRAIQGKAAEVIDIKPFVFPQGATPKLIIERDDVPRRQT